MKQHSQEKRKKSRKKNVFILDIIKFVNGSLPLLTGSHAKENANKMIGKGSESEMRIIGGADGDMNIQS